MVHSESTLKKKLKLLWKKVKMKGRVFSEILIGVHCSMDSVLTLYRVLDDGSSSWGGLWGGDEVGTFLFKRFDFSLLFLLCHLFFPFHFLWQTLCFLLSLKLWNLFRETLCFSFLFLLWNLQVLSLNFRSAFLFLTWIFHDRGHEYIRSFYKTTRPWDHANYLVIS